MNNYYFDLDGVLADWVGGFNECANISLNEFNEISKQERDAIKVNLFNYDFFRDLNPLQSGIALIHDHIKKYGVDRVFVLSATGHINVDEVKKAKIDWLHEHIPELENAIFVPKLEDKPKAVVIGNANNHILYDDRKRAIEAWDSFGLQFQGILFVGE